MSRMRSIGPTHSASGTVREGHHTTLRGPLDTSTDRCRSHSRRIAPAPLASEKTGNGAVYLVELLRVTD